MSPFTHALCGLPLMKDPALLKAITSHFFLETGELFSEYKLLAAFLQRHLHGSPPPILSPLTYFIFSR